MATDAVTAWPGILAAWKGFSKPNDPVAQFTWDTFGAISSDLAALCWPDQV